MSFRSVAALLTLPLAAYVAFSSAAASDVATTNATSRHAPASVEQAAACMLQELKSVPGVKNAKLGHSTEQGWSHPFLSYEPNEKDRWAQPTRFEAQKPNDPTKGSYYFIGYLPGVHAEGTALDFHVTDEVIRRWQTRCKVQVMAITV